MDYAEFRIRIRCNRAGSCEVTVEESPDGGAILEGWRPPAPQEVQRLLGHVFRDEEARREFDEKEGDAPPVGKRARRLEWDRASQRELGCFLFDLLFKASVRERLVNSLQALHIHRTVGRGPTALRLRLTFGAPGNPASLDAIAHLAALPWELLYFPDRNSFVSIDEETPLVRSVDTPGYQAPLEVDPPLKVLVVEALPCDKLFLGLGQEIQNLCNHLTDSSPIRLEVLKHATFDALHVKLKTEPIHVFHFLGHGGTGRILLEDSRGKSDEVSTERLARLLRMQPSLRLAVLNACKTAKFPGSRIGPALGGVATGLILAGVPAVVAMQVSIRDPPAIDFADAFYRALAGNEPIELAVTRGRQAIREKALQRACEARAASRDAYSREWWNASQEALEWPTPVLYSRAKKGNLFQILPVVEVFGIRFRQVAGIYLAERPLTEADWDCIEGTSAPSSPASPLSGKRTTIAAVEALFRRSRARAQAANDRVDGLRLPSKGELQRAYAAGARGLINGQPPYHYCATEESTFPFGAVKGDAPADVLHFRSNSWNATYSLHCVVRPVVDLRPEWAIPRSSRSRGVNGATTCCDLRRDFHVQPERRPHER